MRKLLVFAALGFLSLQCEPKRSTPEPELTVCGVKEPAKELVWLKEIIAKAEEDRINKTHSGNYTGTIYLEKFNHKDVFWTNMTMGSGGLAMRVYQCDGQPVSFADSDQLLAFANTLSKTRLIYNNAP